MSRYVREVCPTCKHDTLCFWCGDELKCVWAKHKVRMKHKIQATMPKPKVVKKSKGTTLTVPVAVQLKLF